MRLRDPRLYRRLDWADICQSVLASFFMRAAAGQYDLDQPEQLLRLLVVMTRHKLSSQERRHRAEKRDYRLAEDLDQASLEAEPGAEPTPSRLVAGRELLEAFRARLSDEERMLADLRSRGLRMGGDLLPIRRHAPGASHATGPRGPACRAAARGM